MPRARHTAPRVDPVRYRELRPGDQGDLRPRADLDGLAFADVRATRLDLATGATISDCRLTGLTADDLDLSTSRLTDTTLGQVDVTVSGRTADCGAT